jgi:hypothetical protein
LTWTTAERELEVEFSGDGTAEYLAIDLVNGTDEEGEFELADYVRLRDLLAWLPARG